MAEPKLAFSFQAELIVRNTLAQTVGAFPVAETWSADRKIDDEGDIAASGSVTINIPAIGAQFLCIVGGPSLQVNVNGAGLQTLLATTSGNGIYMTSAAVTSLVLTNASNTTKVEYRVFGIVKDA